MQAHPKIFLCRLGLSDVQPSQMAPAPKDERFLIRMSADEREMLRTLADKAGESEAAIVRRLVRAAFEAQAPKKKR